MERRHTPIAQNKVSFRPIASGHDQSDAVEDIAADDNLVGICGLAVEIYPDSIQVHVSSPFSKPFDGPVKSPSAALRFTFVAAAYLLVHLTPQFLRAWHLELFTKPSFCGFFT
jgi:hypothetical protein